MPRRPPDGQAAVNHAPAAPHRREAARSFGLVQDSIADLRRPRGLHCVHSRYGGSECSPSERLLAAAARPSLVYEMVRSSTSPLVWNGVLPRHELGGAPIRWEFEPGLVAFTSTAGGKPTTHYVKRVAYKDSTIAGTYDGPGGVHCVIVATADPNVVQAGAWGSADPSWCAKWSGVLYNYDVAIWCGTASSPPQLFGGAPIRVGVRARPGRVQPSTAGWQASPTRWREAVAMGLWSFDQWQWDAERKSPAACRPYRPGRFDMLPVEHESAARTRSRRVGLSELGPLSMRAHEPASDPRRDRRHATR